jgi:hypothetical protein
MKIIRVEKCALCPFVEFRDIYPLLTFKCKRIKNKEFLEIDCIPSWCPLEDEEN